MKRSATEFRAENGSPLFRFTCARCGFEVIQATEPRSCFCTPG